MSDELYQCYDKLGEIYAPRRRHRQSLAPWISGVTSILMKKLKTHREVLEENPTRYRKQALMKFEILVTESPEIDRLEYQEHLLNSN